MRGVDRVEVGHLVVGAVVGQGVGVDGGEVVAVAAARLRFVRIAGKSKVVGARKRRESERVGVRGMGKEMRGVERGCIGRIC